ncbi:MAG: DUF1189 family protein [Anaerolineae bacterium]
MEVSSAPAAVPESQRGSGFLNGLAWFFSGAVLPMGSFSFYRAATRRSVGMAILFFFAFTLFITTLSTISIGTSMAGLTNDIRQAYQQGKVPEITITGGIAHVDGPQPVIFYDSTRTGTQGSNGPIFVAADTTGRITQIDQSVYEQGFLLTRTELHILNSGGRYQRMPLSQLNQLFSQDPLLINGETVSRAWVGFSAILSILVFVGLVLWNSLVRLMIIALLALVFWGIGSLIRPKIGFEPFIITGLYAIVPAIYISHLFSRSGASFPGLQTCLLVIFWIAGLVGALGNDKFFTAPNPLRLWTALLGVPMLVLFIVDMFVTLPEPVGKAALWVVTALTILALIVVRLYFHLTSMQAPPAPSAPMPAA